MNEQPEATSDGEVRRDGIAMLGILALAIILIVFVGYNVI